MINYLNIRKGSSPFYVGNGPDGEEYVTTGLDDLQDPEHFDLIFADGTAWQVITLFDLNFMNLDQKIRSAILRNSIGKSLSVNTIWTDVTDVE